MEFQMAILVIVAVALGVEARSYRIRIPVTQYEPENDLTCYTCADMGSNHECNRWAPDKYCPIGHTVCESVHRFHRHSGKSVLVEKRCARPTECTIESIGCKKLHSKHHKHQMECRSCCTDSYCNRGIPHNKTTALQLSASMFTRTTSGTSRVSFSPIIALIAITWAIIT